MDEVVERITNYLSAGGLFNPELMEHEKVRDLLVDCRDALKHERERTAPVIEAAEKVLPEVEHAVQADGYCGSFTGDCLACDLKEALAQFKEKR